MLRAGKPQPVDVMEHEFKRPIAGLAQFLADLSPGEPRTFGDVTVLPLIARTPASLAFPLDPSGPPSPAGSHDEGNAYQTLQNSSDAVRIALLGQVLYGEKTQDRASERTQLLPAGGRTSVMAYCCEHLFMAQIGQPLEMTPHFLPGGVRMYMAQQYAELLAQMQQLAVLPRNFDNVQNVTWSEIALRLHTRGVPSRYEAFLDLIPARSPEVLAAARAPLPAGTTGFAIGAGDKLLAIEVFGSPALLAAQAPELIASWLDRVPAPAGNPVPDAVRAEAVTVLATPPRAAALIGSDVGAVTLALSYPYRGLALSLRGRPVHALLVP